MIEENFELRKRAEVISITFDEEHAGLCMIEAHTKCGQKIGEIRVELRLIEDDMQCFNYHYLVDLSLNMLGEDYLKQGIGTRILELYRKHCVEDGQSFTAANYDGQQRDDGSHLTGDGLPFVNSMIEKKILDSGGSYPDGLNPEYEEETY